MIGKQERTQINVQQNMEQHSEPHNWSNNKQRINNNRTAAKAGEPKPPGGLHAFYSSQIFALVGIQTWDSAIIVPSI